MTEDARTSEVPLLERWGSRVVAEGAPLRPSIDAVHVLNEDEQRALRRIERAAVARSALAGVLSALASSVTEVLVGHHFRLDHTPTRADLAAYFSIYGAVTLVASVAEVVYLYWDGLRSVRALAHAAGADLGGSPGDRHAVASALARAALELPDPDTPVLGVDPRSESNRLQLLFASTLYKLKVGLSSFLFKALLRRALGRFATRQLLAFAAVPVNALWNGLVTFFVLREARVRLLGPSAAREHLDTLLAAAELSDEGREAVAAAAAAAIVRSEHAHPNLVFLLREVVRRVGPLRDAVVLDDAANFGSKLRALPPRERTVAMRVFAFAAIVDGKLARRERVTLAALRSEHTGDPRTDDVEALAVGLVRGEPLDLATLR